MMSEERVKDFWYEFDNATNPDFKQLAKATNDAMGPVFNLSGHFKIGTLTTELLSNYIDKEEDKDLIPAMKVLMPLYFGNSGIIDKFFGPNFELHKHPMSMPQMTFTQFGLGKIYDDRPPRKIERHMHMMDFGGAKGGFVIWHRFNWTASLIDSTRIAKWKYLDQLLGAAAEIDSISKPHQSDPNTGKAPDNPPNGTNVSNFQIEAIVGAWLDLDFDQIEDKLAGVPDHIRGE